MQDPLWNAVEIDLSKIIVWTNRWKVVVNDALHHNVISILKGIEVMEHKSIWSLKDARFLTSETTTISRNQPKAPFSTRLGCQTLRSALFSSDKRQRIEGNSVLKKYRPVGCYREVVQEREARKTIGSVVQKHTSIWAIGGELH